MTISRGGEIVEPGTSAPCRLTVKLRGRPEAPTKRRGRILSSRARGAITQAGHGPLQRLLDGPITRPRSSVSPTFQHGYHDCVPTQKGGYDPTRAGDRCYTHPRGKRQCAVGIEEVAKKHALTQSEEPANEDHVSKDCCAGPPEEVHVRRGSV